MKNEYDLNKGDPIFRMKKQHHEHRRSTRLFRDWRTDPFRWRGMNMWREIKAQFLYSHTRVREGMALHAGQVWEEIKCD